MSTKYFARGHKPIDNNKTMVEEHNSVGLVYNYIPGNETNKVHLIIITVAVGYKSETINLDATKTITKTVSLLARKSQRPNLN